MYSGESPTYITGKTDTTRQINCTLDIANCSYDRTRWVETSETICEGKTLRSVLAEETSSDGIVWTRSGKIKLDRIIDEDNDAVCGANSIGKFGKWMQVDGYICDGTTKYRKIAFFTSDILEDIYIRTNVEDKGDVLETNSEDCGWFEGINKYDTRWEKVGEECLGTTKCSKLVAKYFSKEDGSEYTPSINQYRYEEIEKNSKYCGYVAQYRWILTDTVKCFECNG